MERKSGNSSSARGLGGGLTRRLDNHLLVILLAATVAHSEQTVSVQIEPEKPYIERRDTEQRLNFDLLLHNSTAIPLRINKIQISVYDSQGALAFRRYLDENARPSGISTLPDRIVPAGGTVAVFNPFYSFEADMPLATLHYEVSLEKTDEKEPNLLTLFNKAETDVQPVAYATKTRLVLPLRGLFMCSMGTTFTPTIDGQPSFAMATIERIPFAMPTT